MTRSPRSLRGTLCALLLSALAACTTTAPPPTEGAEAATAPRAAPEPTVSAVVPSSPADAQSEPPVPATPETRPAGTAIGDLLVAPTRIVFEGSKRTAEVTLVNVGTSRGTYRISMIDYQMDPSGKLQEIDPEANPSSASRLVRYSPRQVTLEPNYMQTIRILLRKPSDLPPGEYRSHMLFRSIPEPTPAPDPAERPQEGLSIELTPIFGISIPLIIRHGEVGADAEIEDLTLVPDSVASVVKAVSLTLVRKGAKSVFGRLRVTFRPESGGAATVVGLMNGVAVYPPLERRQVTIPIEGEAAPLGPGVLVVTYSDLEGDEERVYAEATARVP